MARTKVYHKRGGAELIVASGGKVTIESGGTLEVAAGATATGLVAAEAATTTTAGAVELATDAEAQTGTDTARAITPANLQAVTGTESRKGVLELATDVEAKAGTDTARAITAANLKAVLAALDFPIVMSKTGATISMGTLSSANDTSGVALSNSKTSALKICADTGGVALTAGFERAIQGRFLLGTAISSGADISAAGIEGLLKSIASVNVSGNRAGIMGHYESEGTLTITGTINTVNAGVAAFLDLGANATVAAGTVMSAFGVNPANFGTTMNGRTSIIHVANPMSGTWGSFLELSTATGCTQDTAAGSGGHKYLKVYINGTLYTIDMVTA